MKHQDEMWVVWTIGFPDWQSISYTRKNAIQKYIKGTTLNWRQFKRKYGCKCLKTKIEFYAND